MPAMNLSEITMHSSLPFIYYIYLIDLSDFVGMQQQQQQQQHRPDVLPEDVGPAEPR